MVGAEKDGLSEEAVRAETERILSSDCFRPSGTLRNLLSYLVNTTLAGSADQIKEYTLAVQVLGQPPTFDSRLNNVVRVHAHRLRDRLRKYYGQEGADSQIVVELPVGSYVPRFRLKESPLPSPPSAVTPAAPDPPPPVEAKPEARRSWLLAAATVGLAAGLLAGFLLSRLSHPDVAADGGGADVSALLPFWRPLWTGKAPTILALANRKFLLDSYGDYLLYGGSKTGPPGTWMDTTTDVDRDAHEKLLRAGGRLQFNDAITGVGEAESIHVLTEVFGLSHSRAVLRKSRLLRLDDLRTNNVIFLGSPSGHPLMSHFVSNLHYTFSDGGITDRDAGPNQTSFRTERDPATGALTRDFGIIAMMPGPGQNSRIVVLAGNWTYGTLGATRFVTDPAGVAALFAYPGMIQSGHLPDYFEAVVQCEMVQDEVGPVKLVAARPLHIPRAGVQ
jgi:hypothetical protein